jgi:hypothetical protein
MTPKLKHSLQAVNLAERLEAGRVGYHEQPKIAFYILREVRSNLNKAGVKNLGQAYHTIKNSYHGVAI